jgi:hypothetical protein
MEVRGPVVERFNIETSGIANGFVMASSSRLEITSRMRANPFDAVPWPAQQLTCGPSTFAPVQRLRSWVEIQIRMDRPRQFKNERAEG